jgi:acetylornithine/succinyldiaminopimelate/putrescine aminotransferase
VEASLNGRKPPVKPDILILGKHFGWCVYPVSAVYANNVHLSQVNMVRLLRILVAAAVAIAA